jgi:hypothetical protein
MFKWQTSQALRNFLPARLAQAGANMRKAPTRQGLQALWAFGAYPKIALGLEHIHTNLAQACCPRTMATSRESEKADFFQALKAPRNILNTEKRTFPSQKSVFGYAFQAKAETQLILAKPLLAAIKREVQAG